MKITCRLVRRALSRGFPDNRPIEALDDLAMTSAVSFGGHPE